MSKSGWRISNLGGPKRTPAAASRHPIIPNEIFLEIFSYIQPSVEMALVECTHVLSQLSLACSFFCTVLRPRLFFRLVLDERNDSRSVAFCQALIRGDARARTLALHIRNCRISRWLPRRNRAAMSSIMICHRALFWALNIESLWLTCTEIGTEFWNIISTLSNLRTFQAFAVSFKADIPAPTINRIAGLQLSSLEIFGSHVFSLPRILNTTTLSKLNCDPEFLNTLLDAGASLSTLETLDLISDSISMWSLIGILSKVPSLRSFAIHSDIIEGLDEVTPQDFVALLPNLDSLACWLPLLTFLAPGRPLVSLIVMDDSTPPLDLDTVLGSHAPYTTITDLGIPSTITFAAGHFPHLRKLVVILPPYIGQFCTPGPEATATLTMAIVQTCASWPVYHSVQQLRIATELEFPLFDLALQHTMLSGLLLQKLPALRWFQLGDHVKWEKLAADEAWRVLIPFEHQAYIVAGFEAGDPGVVDYDGYLRQLSIRARNLP